VRFTQKAGAIYVVVLADELDPHLVVKGVTLPAASRGKVMGSDISVDWSQQGNDVAFTLSAGPVPAQVAMGRACGSYGAAPLEGDLLDGHWCLLRSRAGAREALVEPSRADLADDVADGVGRLSPGRRARPGRRDRDRLATRLSTLDGRHARHRLDEAMSSPVRLSLIAALAQVDEAEFAHVRDTIEVSDSVLSRHAAQLETVGYVKIRKGYVGKRPRTWLSLTPAGRTACTRHLAALRAIADGL